MSNAAHPGYAHTNLQTAGASLGRDKPTSAWVNNLSILPHQEAEQGTEPLLLAATSADATNGGYYGPIGRFNLVGPTGPAKLDKRMRDTAVAERLWERAAELTGVGVEVDSS